MKVWVTGADLFIVALLDIISAAYNKNLDLSSELVAMECDRHIITACNRFSTGAGEIAWHLEAKSISIKSQPKEARNSPAEPSFAVPCQC